MLRDIILQKKKQNVSVLTVSLECMRFNKRLLAPIGVRVYFVECGEILLRTYFFGGVYPLAQKNFRSMKKSRQRKSE